MCLCECVCVRACVLVCVVTNRISSPGIVLEDYVLYVRISICLSRIQQHLLWPGSGGSLVIIDEFLVAWFWFLDFTIFSGGCLIYAVLLAHIGSYILS